MSSSGLKKAYLRLKAALRRRSSKARMRAELAKRIEQRALYATLEACAYTDQQLADLAGPAQDIRYVEARARMAVEEATAYADAALHTLTMSLRGVSNVTLELSRRVAALEAAQLKADERGRAVERKAALLSEQIGALATSSDQIERDLREPHLVDEELRALARDVVRLETALREIDGRISATATGERTGDRSAFPISGPSAPGRSEQ